MSTWAFNTHIKNYPDESVRIRDGQKRWNRILSTEKLLRCARGTFPRSDPAP